MPKHTLDIPQHLIVPVAQDLEAARLQHRRPARILLRRVLAAVYFNEDVAFDACKIGDEAGDRILATEFDALKLAVAQL